MNRFIVLGLSVLASFTGFASAQNLNTRWTKSVTAENAHREYPRPQLVRDKWQNLNGHWQYAIRPLAAKQPSADQFDGQILVPFPIESTLSGVKKTVDDGNALWYRRTFSVPKDWSGQHVWMHFGAVDWQSTVWVNGKQVGEHRGGYDPFSFDVTTALKADGEQELVVSVSDPTDSGTQPRGKQIRRPHGIWYTPTTGIWQTVWLEPVPENSIAEIKTETDVDPNSVTFVVSVRELGSRRLRLTILEGNQRIESLTMRPGEARIRSERNDWKLWSPASPNLYDLKVELLDADKVVDSVTSYFAVRKISLGQDAAGVTRVMLNNKFVFQYGPLDQGFWPDGLYTAPSDEALRYDLEVTKRLGFNMVRKHVKVEPARWYYHCDRLGLLVWQDMPSGDKYIRSSDPDVQRSPESSQQFETEWAEIIRDFGHFPCIVMWVPFNEGWGQFDTARIVEFTRKLDPTRLVNNASGWTDRGVGDVHDIHVYPGPGIPPRSPQRALVLGEFGGLGLPLEGHTWQAKNNWGYRSFNSRETLNDSYAQLLTRLRVLVGQGLSAAVYTQTTDVEIEVNGFMTYDREVVKFDETRVKELHRKLHLPPPQVIDVVPSSRDEPMEWRFTTEKPTPGWEQTGFDDSSWKRGPGGFGEPSTPGSVVRTNWKTPDIWLRREIEISSGDYSDFQLLIHHDEDTDVFLDGKPIARTTGYTTSYVVVPFDAGVGKSIKSGRHTLAVHCHQTGGGQYIDVGLVDVREVAGK